MNERNKYRGPDLDFFFLIVISLFLCVFFTHRALAGDVKIVALDDEKVARVAVSTRGTVLSFPIKPTKVILGKSGSFGLEYVENDLAISPLSSASRSNLFVYLLGRRFSFDLIATPSEGSAIILVRDAPRPNQKKGQTRGR